MATAVSSTSTFAIHPSTAGGSAGSVTVATAAEAVRLHVVLTGLAPGSAHAVHDHLGSCAGAGGSRHLRTLAVVTAGADGVGVADATVPPFDAGAGRIVIVYASPSPDIVTGCADL